MNKLSRSAVRQLGRVSAIQNFNMMPKQYLMQQNGSQITQNQISIMNMQKRTFFKKKNGGESKDEPEAQPAEE
jgi:hypothetical protein